MRKPMYPFIDQAGRVIKSGQSNAIIMSGNIEDLFYVDGSPGAYTSLSHLLAHSYDVSNRIVITYNMNKGIRFANEAGKKKMRKVWKRCQGEPTDNQHKIDKMLQRSDVEEDSFDDGDSGEDSFDKQLVKARGNIVYALELLRMFCLCSRTRLDGGLVMPEHHLIILIENADVILPNDEYGGQADDYKVGVCHTWFSDPEFMNSHDAVLLIAESKNLINRRITRLPYVYAIDIPAPTTAVFSHFVEWFISQNKVKLWGTQQQLAELSAGLSVHALQQLLKAAAYQKVKLTADHVISRLEKYVAERLEGIGNLKVKKHSLSDLVGFTQFKKLARERIMPRLRPGPGAISGLTFCGPIGCGKTFAGEAIAGELNMPVIEIPNLRNMYVGETDVRLERLRRLVESLHQVVIFIDEADTAFGGISKGEASHERRLTGKIQQMMSDTKLRGKVFWFLLTARIHLLSPDIRRPGRAGDLIISILDPEGEDKLEFVRWMVAGVLDGNMKRSQLNDFITKLDTLTEGYSVSDFDSMRRDLIAEAGFKKRKLMQEEILTIVSDRLPADISLAREYQIIQAKLNCRIGSLLPPKDRTLEGRKQLMLRRREIERMGI